MVNHDEVVVVAHGTRSDDADVVLVAAQPSTYQKQALVAGWVLERTAVRNSDG